MATKTAVRPETERAPVKEPQGDKAAAPDKSENGALILFNNSANPYDLGKNPDGSRRVFAVGQSMECLDREEYDRIRKYKNISTTKQVSPSLDGHIRKLQAEKSAQIEEIAALKKQLEKFQKGE